MCVYNTPPAQTADFLLPQGILEGLGARQYARQLKAVQALIQSVVERTIASLKNCAPAEFDCLAGDFACEVRALALLRLFGNKELLTEAETLREGISQLKAEEIKSALEKMTVSRGLLLLFNCSLLQPLVVVHKELPNGIKRLKTDSLLLKNLSKKIRITPDCFRNKLIEGAQRRVSELSMETIRLEAAALGDRICITMLSPENTRLYAHNQKYEPKSIGCLFYRIKTVIFQLRQERALIAIKNISIDALKRYTLLFRPEEVGGEFVPVGREELGADPQRVLLIIEAVIQPTLTAKEASQRLNGKVTEILLASGAIEEQYEKAFPLESISNKEAIEEIERYRKLAPSLGCGRFETVESDAFIIVDHLFCGAVNDLYPNGIGGGNETP